MINVINGELYQYDIGRQVKIISKKNYIIDEVHFCNEDSESALKCKAVYDESSEFAIAPIPNILLQSSKDLIVYATIITDDSRQTVERGSFHIHKRKRPDDYVYTETEVFIYKHLEDRIKKLEELPVDSEFIANVIKEYMDNNPVKTVTKVSELENDIGYLTEISSEYVTDKELEQKGFITKDEIPDVPVNTSDLSNDSGFITKDVNNLDNYYQKRDTYSKEEIDNKGYLTEHQDLSGYAKTENIPTKVSQLENDKEYLTEHQDLTDYAKTEVIPTDEHINGLIEDKMGGEYELIETITLAEDVEVMEITLDNLKDLYMVFTSPPQLSENRDLNVNVIFDGSLRWYHYCMNFLTTTVGHKSFFSIRKNYNKLSAAQGYNGGNLFQANNIRYTERIMSVDCITGIRMETTKKIPAGTTIEIWGVRANA